MLHFYGIHGRSVDQPYLHCLINFLGGTLEKMIDQRTKLGFELTKDFGTQILKGLQFMHSEHVAHRDLKADNVLLNRERNIVKIADMGLAKIVRTDRQLSSMPIYSAGAPIIQSPEQKAGRANGKKNDMWLFGLLIIWMFHGKRTLFRFMDECEIENYPDPSAQESPNFNELLSAIFVPEKQRYDATNLLYKLEGGWSCAIS